jgi:hypothetical protein
MLIVSSTDFMSHFLKYHPRKLISLGKNHSLFTRDVRDRDQKNYTLPGPGPGLKEKLYRDQNRDREQRLNPRLYDGLNSVNFCTSEVTLF